MNKTNEQNAGNSSNKPSFQPKNLGPNKVASTETPAATKPDVKPDTKPDVKPEVSPVILEVTHQVTAKPVKNKPLLQKQS